MYIIWRIVREIFWFPFWWYSQGWFSWIGYWRVWLIKTSRGLALMVWLKNLFVPMYGQKDAASFIISFVIRLIQIVFRLAIWLVCWLIALVAIMAWPATPLAIFYYLYLLYYGQES
ncbi:MAG TPA: hypothetical protein PLT32_01505 [bacterium]|nr:hypothetical protein [bacterium]